MLLTEDEAKTKGCPYKPMTYVTLGYVEEAVPQGVRFDTCSGSECMGWRWGKIPDRERRFPDDFKARRIDEEPIRPSNVPATWIWCNGYEDDYRDNCWIEPESESVLRREGYCGLAGRVTE